MKKAKRNAVIITILLFVGAAVYLNWSYNKSEPAVDAAAEKDADSAGIQETDAGENAEDSGLFYETDEPAASLSAEDEYFDNIRLTRQQTRDEARATLQVVSETDGASQETIDEALAGITQLAERTVLESELENKIVSKGYSDCVVYISDDDISVTVKSGEEALSKAAVAQITDIITSNTEFTAQNIKINEIK